MKQNGFTLLEVLVAMLLFLVVSSTMANTFISHLKHNTDAEVESGAIALAQQRLDELRFLDPATLPTSGATSENESVGGRNYTVETLYCETPAYCISGNNRHLVVRVNYAGAQIFRTETVYTRLR